MCTEINALFSHAGLPSCNTSKTYVDYRDPHIGMKDLAQEVEADSILFESVVGWGEFGEVWKATVVHRDIEGNAPMQRASRAVADVVAVKRLKHGASLIDQTNFLREACTMAQFFDPNIIQLKGVVTKSKWDFFFYYLRLS